MQLYKFSTAAEKLGVTTDDLKALVKSGKLSIVQIDGVAHLRAEQVDALKAPGPLSAIPPNSEPTVDFNPANVPGLPDTIDSSSKPDRPKDPALRIAIGVGLALFAFYFLFNFTGFTTAAKPTRTPRPDVGSDTMAFVMCEGFVEDRLKSPSSAEFGRYNSENVTKVDSNTWLVLSYVDAQNSFGAMIRNDYLCQIDYTGNDNWRLIDLVME